MTDSLINTTVVDIRTPFTWDWMNTIYMVFKLIWIVLSIFGNTLTVIAIAKFEYLQTVSNSHLVSLAVADLIHAVMHSCFSFIIYFVDSLWLYFCVMKDIFGYISYDGNILSIFLISLDRFVFIHRPLRYSTLMTKRRVLVLLSLIWVYTCSLTVALNVLSVADKRETGYCDLVDSSPLLAFWVFQPTFWVSSCCIVLMYSSIAFMAYKQRKRVAHEMNVSGESSSGDHKISRMMTSVVGVYFILNIPVLLVMSFGDSYSIWGYITTIIFRINTWVNPLIYCIQNKMFRKAYKTLMHIYIG